MGLLEELSTQALNRDEEQGWTREIVGSLPEARNPELLTPFAKAYMGENALTIRDTKVRKVVGSEVSPGELARLYMKGIMSQSEGMLSKKIPWRRDALQFLDRHPAYYFAGQQPGPFVLVDIKACYATLYSRLALDVTYRPECDPPLLGIGRGSFVRVDEWNSTKGPRNALWGNLLRPRIREWRHGEPIDDALPNRYFAPDLTGVVLDATHAIACHARENGAMSWAVDGGVFRPDDAHRFIEWLRETFNLEAEVRAEGPGWIFGATSYSIGPVVTEDVRKGLAHQWPEMNKLRRIPKKRRAWLGSVFSERS